MEITISKLKEILSYFSDDDLIVLDGVYKSNITIIRNRYPHGGYAQIQFRKNDKNEPVSITITGDVKQEK